MSRRDGLRVRFARIPGETGKGVLARRLILPAALNRYGWTEEFTHNEYETIRSGSFSVPTQGGSTARPLRTMDEVETLIIQWNPKWLVESGQDPDDVRDALYEIGRSKTPVDMLATLGVTSRKILGMDVTFRSIAASMREGEPDTIYYSIGIKEWREASGKRKGKGSDKLPTTHELTDRDTLYSLSKKYYDTPLGFREIAQANGIRGWGKNDPLVKMKRYKRGSKIKIPRAFPRPPYTPAEEREAL